MASVDDGGSDGGTHLCCCIFGERMENLASTDGVEQAERCVLFVRVPCSASCPSPNKDDVLGHSNSVSTESIETVN